MNHSLSNLFDFLPQQIIKATDLKRGDVVKIHQLWVLVFESKADPGFDNHGLNHVVVDLNGNNFYLHPEDGVSIIQRNLLDQEKVSQYINRYIEEELRFQRLAEQAEAEAIAEEKAYLQQRLRELED